MKKYGEVLFYIVTVIIVIAMIPLCDILFAYYMA